MAEAVSGLVAGLVERTPCDGLLPVIVGALTLDEVAPGPMTLVAPFRGREGAVAKVLQDAFGLELPGPNRAHASGGARALWIGPGRVLLCGVAPPDALAAEAAIVAQSDGHAAVRLAGAGAVDVLARLVPVDLRAPHFPPGSTARTLLGHMTVSVTRWEADPEAFEILAMRSMAGTLVQELRHAMEGVTARATA